MQKDVYANTRRRRGEGGGRERREVATDPGMRAGTRRWKRQRMDAILEPSKRVGPADTLILDSRVVREYISVVLSPKVCGNLYGCPRILIAAPKD